MFKSHLSFPKYVPQLQDPVTQILNIEDDLQRKKALDPESTNQTQECTLGRNLPKSPTLRKSGFLQHLVENKSQVKYKKFCWGGK